MRPHEGTKTDGYTKGNAPHTEKTSVFEPCVVYVVVHVVVHVVVYVVRTLSNPVGVCLATCTDAPHYGGRTRESQTPGVPPPPSPRQPTTVGH